MKIIGLEPHPTQPDRWVLTLDGHPPLTLDGATVVAERLVVGADLEDADIDRLRAAMEERRLLDAALGFLAARPRSRAEVRRRLARPSRQRAAPAPEQIEATLARLEELGLLDDREFASFWVEQRERFSPRAAYALNQELRQRGVDRETAASAADPEDDAARALAAARQRLRLVRGADYATFRTRLGGFLLRRGFQYGIAREVIRQLWEETANERPPTDFPDDEAIDTYDE